MRVRTTTLTPTAPVSFDATAVCPRCHATRIVCLRAARVRAFDWYECQDCGNLWAFPRGKDTAVLSLSNGTF